MEEPSDEVLSQLMREVADEVRAENEEATRRFFGNLHKDAINITRPVVTF